MKKVPLLQVHIDLGAKIVPFAGFDMPVQYSTIVEEHLCVAKNVGVFDVSHMGEFLVEGASALDLIQFISSNDASKLNIGEAQYAYIPNENGGIVDDFLVYKIKDKQYLLVVNAGNIEKDWDWITHHNQNFGATLRNVSNDYCLFAVQGPKAIEVLQKLTSIDLAAIKYYNFVVGKMAGLEHLIISATGYTGCGGFELYVSKNEAKQLWDKIFEAGKEFAIKPIGLAARDTLRIEQGYCLYGNDINDHTSPIEAGLGWVTKFNKSFVNSENLKNEKSIIAKQKLVGFKFIERGIPRKDYEIFNDKNQKIGIVTSGTQSPSLNLGIGMGYIQTDYSRIGKKIYIQIRDKKIAAEIVSFPFVSHK
jgi:aminomethyltransferase